MVKSINNEGTSCARAQITSKRRVFFVKFQIAADKVGATKMDRPEDIQCHPRTGTVYCALSNNVERGVTAGKEGATEPNPRVNNRHGQVLELTERRSDALALTFNWGLFMVCGFPEDPNTYFGGYDKSQVSPISSPDNVAFDRHGHLPAEPVERAEQAGRGPVEDGPQLAEAVLDRRSGQPHVRGDLEVILATPRREIARYHPDKVQHLGPEFQEIAATRAAELTEAAPRPMVVSDRTRPATRSAV